MSWISTTRRLTKSETVDLFFALSDEDQLMISRLIRSLREKQLTILDLETKKEKRKCQQK
jgi:predicted ferric reductase